MTREEAIKTVKEHCYFASLVPEAREALDLIIKTVEDFEALNALNLDLASENEDLVERIGKLIGYIDFLRNVGTGKKKSLDYLEKVVKGQIKEIRAEGENFVKPKTGEWIPVTERLPKEEGFYLVTRRITDDVATFIFRRTPTSKDYWKRCVTAWMPLPEPYNAESEET